MNHTWHTEAQKATLTIGANLLSVTYCGEYNGIQTWRYEVQIGSTRYQGSATTMEQGKRLAIRTYNDHLKKIKS